MSNLRPTNKGGECFALWAPVPSKGPAAVVGVMGPSGVTITEILMAEGQEKELLRRLSRCAQGVLLLSPKLYASGLVTDPAGVAPVALQEALRWAFAKDAEIDMSVAEFETLAVRGAEKGGGLLKDSHWVFAIEQPSLKSLLKPLLSSGLRIEAVDVLALAQRNLCWAQATTGREGGHASLVIGSDYSALGIVSRDGDQLFHKQLEWTSDSILEPQEQERFILDLQRNLGYFERRQSAFGLVQGYVYGAGANVVAERLRLGLGGFEWVGGALAGVSVADSRVQLDGAALWLIGSMRRWS